MREGVAMPQGGDQACWRLASIWSPRLKPGAKRARSLLRRLEAKNSESQPPQEALCFCSPRLQPGASTRANASIEPSWQDRAYLPPKPELAVRTAGGVVPPRGGLSLEPPLYTRPARAEPRIS